MRSIEQVIDESLTQFLATRGDKIFTDAGLVRVLSLGSGLRIEIDGERYDVVIRSKRVKMSSRRVKDK